MRVGIISESDYFIPLAYTLMSQQLQVSLFYSPSSDVFINQKVQGFIKHTDIPTVEERNSENDLYQWLSKGIDVCFVIGYKHLIKLNKLTNCTTQLFNIHFGPLPSYQGPIPVFWQLKNGEKQLGLVIHRITDQMDKGQVVWAKDLPNQPHFNYKSIMLLFSQLCVEGVLFILQMILNRLPLIGLDRSLYTPSYHKRPVLKDVTIDWPAMTSNEICDLVRAGNSWNKGAITFMDGQEVKILDALPTEISTEQPAGCILSNEGKLMVACSDMHSLQIGMLIYQDFYCSAACAGLYGFRIGMKFQKI